MERKSRKLLYFKLSLLLALAFMLSTNVLHVKAADSDFSVTYDFNGGIGRYWDVDNNEYEKSVITVSYPAAAYSVGDTFRISYSVPVSAFVDPYDGYMVAKPLKSGYSFNGWAVKGTTDVIWNYTVTDKPVTFVAQWTYNADTYPKDSELQGTVDTSKASTTISGTFTKPNGTHLYKMVLPAGKSIKLDADVQGNGIGDPVKISSGWGAGGSDNGPGLSILKYDEDYHYLDAIHSWGEDFGTKQTFYLNEGTYYLYVICDKVAGTGKDSNGNTIYTGYSDKTYYKSYKYSIGLKFTEVEDVAKGIQNGNRFVDAVDINLGDTVKGVVPLCSTGDANANASLGGYSENYRFTIDTKTTVTAELSNYDKNAKYTFMGLYKEGDTPYYADLVKRLPVVWGEDGEKYTEDHSITAELEPGTYFLYMEINSGLMQVVYYGTPYTLSLRDASLSTDISSCTVSAISAKAYTGKAVTPAVTIKDGSKKLVKGTDYTVAYSNNTKAGKASVTITGIGAYKGTVTKTFLIKKPVLSYRAYVQKKNWMAWQTAKVSGTNASTMAGTTDNLRMETIQMKLSGISGAIKYRAYVEKMGWTQWATTADTTTYAGTKGQSKRVEMIQIQASGEIATLYDMYYRAYSEKFGWLGWAKSGEKSGSAGYGRKLEAFQVNFVSKGDKFSVKSDRTKCFYDKTKDGANPK